MMKLYVYKVCELTAISGLFFSDRRNNMLVVLCAPGNCRYLDTPDTAAVAFQRLVAYVCSRWRRVCVLDFPPRLVKKTEDEVFFTHLRLEYHRISKRLGRLYVSPVLGHHVY